MAELWSYSTGTWRYNRVRVYERRPGGTLHVEWTGGPRQTLANLNNEPVMDRDLAVKIADALARRIDQGRRAKQARELLGLPEQHTLEQLLDRYHRAKEGDWSPGHLRQQRQIRDFWLARLGPNRTLRPAPVTEVEQAVRGKKTPRTRQKYLRYIVSAYRFAERKLKWIDTSENLSPVDLPKARGQSLPHSLAEVLAILDAAPAVDLRVAVACELAYMTGRRANAIRQVRSDTYRVEGDYGVVSFPASTDKARRESEVYVTGQTRERIEMLLQRPLVRSSGWLLPDGDLDRGGPTEPVTYDWLLYWFRKAEEAAGVPHVKGRGLHGFKRRFATMAAGHPGASPQAGTDRRTLERIYEQDNPDAKKALADQMETLRRGA